MRRPKPNATIITALFATLAIASGCNAAEELKDAVSSVGAKVRGLVASGAKRVRAVTASGKSVAADITHGAFEVSVPNERYSLVFDGADGKPVANLAAPENAAASSRTSSFPVSRAVAGKTEVPVIVLGTITFQLEVRIAISEFNILALVDSDGDGLADFQDADDDGDEILDADDSYVWPLDPDDDGTLSAFDDDDDDDGLDDANDDDDDGDGAKDDLEPDFDGDGVDDANDFDDDDDGVEDDADSDDHHHDFEVIEEDPTEDLTPDALIGTWYGETVTEIEGGDVVMQETFVFDGDGTIAGHFEGWDDASGCLITYELEGTWSDDPDGVADLLIGWTLIEVSNSDCSNPEDEAAAEDVTADEGDLWDDELEGEWSVTGTTLVIESSAGDDYEYSRTAN